MKRTPLNSGTSLHRIYEHCYAPEAPNPNVGGNPKDPTRGGRFHPFVDADGNPVPTLYASDHPNGAFAETLMRDDNATRDVDPAAIEANNWAQVTLTQAVILLDLSHTDLEGIYTRWLSGGYDMYVKLRELASYFHIHEKDVQGITWDSKQLGRTGMVNIVLFGDRISATLLNCSNRSPLTSGIGLDKMRRAAMDLDFKLPSGYLP